MATAAACAPAAAGCPFVQRTGERRRQCGWWKRSLTLLSCVRSRALQPREIKEIKDFLITARRKDAKGERSGGEERESGERER